TSYTIPDSVTSISDYAFYSCTGLTSVTIPDSVTSIGTWAFANTGLVSVTIPDGVTSVGNTAFYRCHNLINVTIPDSVTCIDKWTFAQCTSLGNITIPDGVESIKEYAFYGTALTAVVIPTSVTTIGDYAFESCSNLTDVYYSGTEEEWADITIGSSGNSYFANAAIHYSSTGPIASGTCGDDLTWTLEGGILTISGTGEMENYSTSSLPGWYSHRYFINSIVLESGITTVGRRAFVDCVCASNVSIADTVTDFGDAAFYGCASLASIELPSGVTEIPDGMFAGCSSLSSLTAPGVISYGEYAFQETGFSEFTVGKSVTEISSLAFFHTEIMAFAVESGNTVFTASDGVLMSDDGKTLFAYPAGNTASSYEVPSGVTKIWDCAFVYSENLKQITIGSTVTYLGESAFQRSGLTSITIPDNVTDVGDFTFYGCESLTSVKFGSGLKETSYEMFEECSSLTNIDFGTGLESIYARTFAYCDALISVSLPETITSIGNGAFGECTSLVSFSCSGLTVIPYQAFLNDTSLTSLTLGEGLETINRYAFGACYALTEVVLPSTITFVHADAFETVTNLIQTGTSLVSYGKNGLRTAETVTVTGTRDYSSTYAVLEIVNQEREAKGLSALVMNESLLETAMQRAAEISILFSHTRPDGSSCLYLNDLMYGENAAYGDTTAASVMTSWMNSSGHKANILGEDYTTIGIGCFVIDGVYYWIQCFGAGDDTESCESPSNQIVAQQITIAGETFDEASTTSGIIWGSVESYTYELVLELDESQLSVGETTQATVYLKNPGNNALTRIDGVMNWSSSDDPVASVEDGTVTGMGSGATDIQVSTENGYYTDTQTVTIPATGNTNIDNGDIDTGTGSTGDTGTGDSGTGDTGTDDTGTGGTGTGDTDTDDTGTGDTDTGDTDADDTDTGDAN
ncbi:MAG: leucine-rich repeat protein, partial [Oscillospiraceae bacterium]|nr:leucine-rich repeat protein [Oscillospiraceae bacterium]